MTTTVRAGSMRIARIDRDQLTGDRRWTPVGDVTGPVTFAPVLEEAADHYAAAMDLTRGATITVAYRPTRAMIRLLFGWPATADRTRVRRLSRARARARARRHR